MKKVTGIGGIFFKCKDPAKMKEWYSKNLGMKTDEYGTSFEWRESDNPDKKGFTQWSPFEQDTKYIEPSTKDFMINYRVENIEKLVKELKAAGVTICDEIESFEKMVKNEIESTITIEELHHYIDKLQYVYI